jgi:hypothetical protein
VTAADRQRIRAAIDLVQRERRDARIAAMELEVCSRCGCDRDHRTQGCPTCNDRHRRQALRQNPAWLEQERQRENQRRKDDDTFRERRNAQQREYRRKKRCGQ